MALTAFDVLKIIGQRQGSTQYDVLEIIPETCIFGYANPIITLPIPQTGNANATNTKLVNLRRVTRTVTITGYIYESSAMEVTDTCLTNVTVTNFDSAGTYSGGSSVTSVLKKKWLLEQFAMAGTSTGGVGLTLQYRNIITPGTQPPSDETINEYHKKVFITGLNITDSSGESVTGDSSNRVIAERLRVQITLTWGTPQQ